MLYTNKKCNSLVNFVCTIKDKLQLQEKWMKALELIQGENYEDAYQCILRGGLLIISIYIRGRYLPGQIDERYGSMYQEAHPRDSSITGCSHKDSYGE